MTYGWHPASLTCRRSMVGDHRLLAGVLDTAHGAAPRSWWRDEQMAGAGIAGPQRPMIVILRVILPAVQFVVSERFLMAIAVHRIG
jgi:hypothetical protein